MVRVRFPVRRFRLRNPRGLRLTNVPAKPTADDADTNNNPAPLHDPGSPTPEADVEAEDQRLQKLANTEDIWYSSSYAVVRPILLKYKIPHIPAMSEFTTALNCWLGAAAHDPSMQKELANTK